MSIGIGGGPLQAGVEELRKSWGWLVALGAALIVLGMMAISMAFVTTMLSMVVLGWLLIISGAMETVHAAWREREWGGFFLNLMAGILHVVVGFLLVAHPLKAGVALTLIIAMFLMMGGLFRVAAALVMRFPNWGWLLANGAISLALGIAILKSWPDSGLWVVGLFVGIEVVLNGWCALMLGLAVKSIPDPPSTPPSTEAA